MKSELERQIDYREGIFGGYFLPLAMAIDQETTIALGFIQNINDRKVRGDIYSYLANYDGIILVDGRGSTLAKIAESEFLGIYGVKIEDVTQKIRSSHHFFSTPLGVISKDFMRVHAAHDTQIKYYSHSVRSELNRQMRETLMLSDSDNSLKGKRFVRHFVDYLDAFLVPDIDNLYADLRRNTVPMFTEIMADLNHLPVDERTRRTSIYVSENIIKQCERLPL